jgi:hypothetical protein
LAQQGCPSRQTEKQAPDLDPVQPGQPKVIAHTQGENTQAAQKTQDEDPGRPGWPRDGQDFKDDLAELGIGGEQ